MVNSGQSNPKVKLHYPNRKRILSALKNYSNIEERIVSLYGKKGTRVKGGYCTEKLLE